MSGFNVLVHPQAMFIISDHYSRIQFDDAVVHLDYHLGILLGTYENNNIVISSAMEIMLNKKDDEYVLDTTFYNQSMKMHKAIYPNDIVIGWYLLQKATKEEIHMITKAISSSDDIEILLFGEFSTDTGSTPLQLFVPKEDEFVPVKFSYDTELAERIALLNLQSEGSAESQIRFTANAFKSLDEDLKLIETYLQKVANKELEFDPEMMRNCADIAQWWNHSINSHDDTNDDTNLVEEQSSIALLAGTMFDTLLSQLKTLREKSKL